MTREDWKELYELAYDRYSFESFMDKADELLASSSTASVREPDNSQERILKLEGELSVAKDVIRAMRLELESPDNSQAVTLSDEKIDSIWNALPGIKIYNEAHSKGIDTQVALRRALVRAALSTPASKEPK